MEKEISLVKLFLLAIDDDSYFLGPTMVFTKEEVFSLSNYEKGIHIYIGIDTFEGTANRIRVMGLVKDLSLDETNLIKTAIIKRQLANESKKNESTS